MITIKQQFIRFLKQSNIYEYFMWNMTKSKHVAKLVYNDINPLKYYFNNEILWEHALKWNNILRNRRRQLFIQFLQDNNIKELFEKNIKQQNKETLEAYTNKHTELFISQAFLWNITPEGDRFWGEMSSKERNFFLLHSKPISTW